MVDEKQKSADNIFILDSIFPDVEQVLNVDQLIPEQYKDDCVVVIDTNALLVPYTTSKESLTQIQAIYSKLATENRLIIPGRVIREFVKHRPEKLKELYQQLNSAISKSNQMQKQSYPLLEEFAEYQEIDGIIKSINDNLLLYKTKLTSLQKRVSGWHWDDPVSELYRRTFTGTVIFDYKIDREEMVKDLRWRNAYKIPPGYKDSGKDDEGIGDLIIWKTILEIGKTRNTNVLFVSGDEKSDWFSRSESRALFPRFELLEEFHRYTSGKQFGITRLSQLLALFGANPVVVQEIQLEEQVTAVEERPFGQLLRASVTEAFVNKAVLSWLGDKFSDMEVYETGEAPADLIVTANNEPVLAIDLKYYQAIPPKNVVTVFFTHPKYTKVDLAFVFVFTNQANAIKFLEYFQFYKQAGTIPADHKVAIGYYQEGVSYTTIYDTVVIQP